MTQLELAKAIGCHDSTLRRMSPRKRQQWASLAAKGRSIAWFDVLAQLMFEVEAFNAGNQRFEQINVSYSTEYLTVGHYDCGVEQISFVWIFNINQLTEALQYVQGLSK